MSYYAKMMSLAILCMVLGCDAKDSFESIQSDGELVVISRNSPTTYYLDKNGPTGFEYALTHLLAEEMGVALKMKTASNLHDLFTQLKDKEADIAAAGLTLTEGRAAAYPHTIAYNQLTPQVIYVAGTLRPRTVSDLTTMNIAVVAKSSHTDTLTALQQSRAPELTWQEVDEADTMHLLELLKLGHADIAIVDSNEFAVQQSLYPRQKVAFDLHEEQDMVWYLTPETDNTQLIIFINDFLRRLKDDGTMARLHERYFGHTDGVSRISAHVFTQNMQETLPLFRRLIQQVAKEYQMDWHLLAAMAYQESRWDPNATSPTGVRGMMMLTKPTARELGVENRLDVTQSLRGGARYLKDLKRRLPKRLQEPDRTWMALAAYNIGLGHLEDARVITQRQGGNPDVWQDVMQRLPLLEDSNYYEKTRYGYARGKEAVTLVQNIRHYYSILVWQDIPDNQPIPPLRGEDYIPSEINNLQLQAF
ncbi:MAG: membrane-bound lytic murein transglycosylase MltF [Halioglobus sp.]|nr:membrane-bound lytic murein transglycosylase MltF [Halioglobus sp.]